MSLVEKPTPTVPESVIGQKGDYLLPEIKIRNLMTLDIRRHSHCPRSNTEIIFLTLSSGLSLSVWSVTSGA